MNQFIVYDTFGAMIISLFVKGPVSIPKEIVPNPFIRSLLSQFTLLPIL